MDATSAILAAVTQSAAEQADEDAFNASIDRAKASSLPADETVIDPETEGQVLEAIGSVIVSSVILPIIMQSITMARESGEGFE